MYDYEELMNRLSEMRSRFDKGFSPSDRAYIERLYASLLNKKVRKSGCSDCYRDAYIELYHYLKNEGKMPNRPNYVLKAGVVIHPKGTNEFYANTNIPDEIAEAHLAQHPNAINDFLFYPSDYLARIEARKNGEVPATTDDGELSAALHSAQKELEETKAALDETKLQLAAKEKEVEDVKAILKDAQKELEETKAALDETSHGEVDEDGSLTMENETLKADLEAANAEIASLKAQLEEAKASAPKRRTAKSTE